MWCASATVTSKSNAWRFLVLSICLYSTLSSPLISIPLTYFLHRKYIYVKVKGPLILVLDLLIIRRGWYICGNCENGFTVYMYKPFNLYDFRNLSHV